MSSLRHAVQHRTHRERAQPAHRARLGLLEKHKDYSLRAADYARKKQQLRRLRLKAADRNEDEFAFAMLSRRGPGTALSRGKGWTGAADNSGKKKRDGGTLGVDAARLLKTQDLGYVRTLRSVAAREVRGLRERVVLAGGEADDVDEGREEDDVAAAAAARRPRKIVFADDEDGRAQALAQHGEDDDEDEEEDGGKAQNLYSVRRRLRGAREKLKALTDAEIELEQERAKMAKTATSGGFTKSGKRIKVRERKR